MEYLTHLTMETGDSRRSYRREVADPVLDLIQQALTEALADPTEVVPIDGSPLALSAHADGRSAMTFGVWVEGGPMVVLCGVARDSRSGAGLWRVMCRADQGLDLRRPAPPWLAVRLEREIFGVTPEILQMLGDFERCVAWTWLERM